MTNSCFYPLLTYYFINLTYDLKFDRHISKKGFYFNTSISKRNKNDYLGRVPTVSKQLQKSSFQTKKNKYRLFLLDISL